MPDFRQTSLIDQTASGDEARLESEQHLAGAAWAIARRGAIAEATEAEARLIEEAESVPDAVSAALIASIRLGGDPLGEAFARLRSPRRRRSLGAVYTPSAIVDSMVNWVAEHASPFGNATYPGRWSRSIGRDVTVSPVDPPRWTTEQFDKQCEKAKQQFCNQRLSESLGVYAETFDECLVNVNELLVNRCRAPT